MRLEESTNGDDPRREKPTLAGDTFQDRVESALLELVGGQHGLRVDVELHGKRLARIEQNVNIIQRAQVQHGLARASEAPPPMRPPAPSGHFDDFEEDVKTDGGSRLLLTREQLNEHVRKAIDGWSVETQTKSELTTYRTIKNNLSAWAKGGIAAVIAAGFVGAIVAVKNYIDHMIHGPGGH